MDFMTNLMIIQSGLLIPSYAVWYVATVRCTTATMCNHLPGNSEKYKEGM